MTPALKRKMEYPKTIYITVPKGVSETDVTAAMSSADLLKVLQNASGNTTMKNLPITSISMPSGLLVPKTELYQRPLMTVTSQNNENIMNEEPERKRQRLDHLTMEEKINRRKLKNRVAAQTARDRKKMKMDEMEKELEEARLIAQNFEEQNQILMEALERLREENTCLRALLPIHSDNVNKESRTDTECESVIEPITIKKEVESAAISDDAEVPLESAALINDPLPKGQVTLHRQLLALQFLLSLSLYLHGVLTFHKTVLLHSQKQWNKEDVINNKTISVESQAPFCHWWGPHQKSWNPAAKK